MTQSQPRFEPPAAAQCWHGASSSWGTAVKQLFHRVTHRRMVFKASVLRDSRQKHPWGWGAWQEPGERARMVPRLPATTMCCTKTYVHPPQGPVRDSCRKTALCHKKDMKGMVPGWHRESKG